MTVKNIKLMSTEKLRELSLKKNALGNATAKAMEAQVELQARSLHYDGDKNNRYNPSDVKSFEDFDYSSTAYIEACNHIGKRNR